MNTDIFISQLSLDIESYWQRVLSAAIAVTEHIFNTPDNQYPLFYQKVVQGWDFSEYCL